jgi:hypothetical protein
VVILNIVSRFGWLFQEKSGNPGSVINVFVAIFATMFKGV